MTPLDQVLAIDPWSAIVWLVVTIVVLIGLIVCVLTVGSGSERDRTRED